MRISIWKKVLATGVALVALVMANLAEAAPEIRRTPVKPFTASGGRMEAAWKKADTLCYLVNQKIKAVEPFTTKAQMLYDSTNLYVSVTGSFHTPWKAGSNVKRAIDQDNFVTFAIQPDKKAFAITVAESGELRTLVDGKPGEIAGVQKAVKKTKDTWSVSLTIPLASIGMTDVEEAKEVKFNICRHNIDVPKGTEYLSSFAVDGKDAWAPASQTPDPNDAAVVHPEYGDKVNLVYDPYFQYDTDVYTNPDCLMVVSPAGDCKKLLRVKGKKYSFYSARIIRRILKADSQYTMVIRAKRFGAEANMLGVIQLANTAPGKYVQTGGVTWNRKLTENFQEHYTPFKLVANLWSLPFYKLGPNSPDSGIELESIAVYQGKITAPAAK